MLSPVLETFAHLNTFEGIEMLAKVKIATNEFVSLVIKSCTAIPLLLEPLLPSALVRSLLRFRLPHNFQETFKPFGFHIFVLTMFL